MPFEDETTNTRRIQKLLKLIPAALLFAYLIYFLPEIKDMFSVLGWLWAFLLGNPLPVLPETLRHSFFVLAFTLVVGFGMTFGMWLYLFAWQAWLPVESFKEIQKTASHFMKFIQGEHGPTVFVKDGQLKATLDELKRSRPGVLVIDYNSAVALERMVPGPNLGSPIRALFREIFLRPQRKRQYGRPRICGPGLDFTNPAERIHGSGDLKDKHSLEEISGVVDLRNQFRMNEKWLGKTPAPPGPRTSCYTRDGIELKTHVFSLFTIGQEPDVLQVTYLGEHKPENLTVVSLETTHDGSIHITGFGENDELDEIDRREIHQYASEMRSPRKLDPFIPLPTPPRTTVPSYNAQRVFSAIFARARTPDNVVIPWVYLPSHFAMDIFREIISRVNYDDLYGSTPTGQPLIQEYSRQLRVKMRSNGMLSFRLIAHCSKEDLAKNRTYPQSELLVSEVRPLISTKILRDRGIKIIFAGFGDLTPVSEAVYKQRLDHWRASWETDTAIAKAGYELEAMRIRSRAQAQAQQDLVLTLKQIFQREEHSDEVLALRIFQALENYAADPPTNRLLPGETINLLAKMHDWLQAGR
jgi:hypothetical protein